MYGRAHVVFMCIDSPCTDWSTDPQDLWHADAADELGMPNTWRDAVAAGRVDEPVES